MARLLAVELGLEKVLAEQPSMFWTTFKNSVEIMEVDSDDH